MSFFTKKLKPHPPQQPVPYNESRNNDLEEDGFVLVGETEDERNAITPDRRDQDLPPMYQFSENERDFNPSQRTYSFPPTYENTPLRNNPQQSQGSTRGQLNSQTSTSSLHGQNPTAKSPLHDIPFKIDDSVACAFNYGQFNVDIGDEFSWSTAQYHYDFTTERSVVQQSEPL
ncbi:uncharacterized protein LOC120332896 [Styela clava]